jgi:hypothetical protein
MRASLTLLILVLVVSLVLVEAGKKGKGKKGKKPSKGKKPTIFDKFTVEGETCACWWDITKTDCACCKNDGVQCGFPKHKKCYKRNGAKGCPGISKNSQALSSKGFPCFWDHSDKSCAWCGTGKYQCAEGKESPCAAGREGRNAQKCGGVLADCLHMGKDICDINAKCVEGSGRWGKGKFSCKCSEGWKGNGLQCVDADGNFGENPNVVVDLEMTLTNDFMVTPHEDGVYPYGPSQDNLFSMMDGMFNGGQTCNGCNATMIHLSAPVN